MHAAIHAADENDLNPMTPFGGKGMSLLKKSQPLPVHVTFRVSILFVVVVVVIVVIVILLVVDVVLEVVLHFLFH